jgi:hypothetical protein
MLEPIKPKKRSLPLKFVAGFSGGAILGFGLCTASLARAVAGDNWWDRVASMGAGSFFLCVAGLVASLIWWTIDKRRR